MTREEIEKAQVIKLSYFDTPMERIWYNIGCKDGLKAADAEPNLDSLWHDASVVPENGERILAQFGEDDCDTIVLRNFDEVAWHDWGKEYNMSRWAYVSDLLPKKGKEKKN